MYLDKRRLFHYAVLMYKCVNGDMPDYLTDKLIKLEAIGQLVNRATARGDLFMPQANLAMVGSAFSIMGPKIWNSLPMNVREAPSLALFKQSYLTVYGFT